MCSSDLVNDHWNLAVGVGFGGLVEAGTSRPDPDAQLSSQLVSSYSHPNARTPVRSCSGLGVAAVARVEWLTVLGPLSTTGFALEGTGQWTRCVSGTNNVEPDTAQAITIRQWWPTVLGTLSWMVGWR